MSPSQVWNGLEEFLESVEAIIKEFWTWTVSANLAGRVSMSLKQFFRYYNLIVRKKL